MPRHASGCAAKRIATALSGWNAATSGGPLVSIDCTIVSANSAAESPIRAPPSLPISASAFVLGVLYGAWTVAASGRIANGSVLLLMFAVIVFLVGLVSEQISALRFEGRS